MVFHRFQSKTQEHFFDMIKQKIEGQNPSF